MMGVLGVHAVQRSSPCCRIRAARLSLAYQSFYKQNEYHLPWPYNSDHNTMDTNIQILTAAYILCVPLLRFFFFATMSTFFIKREIAEISALKQDSTRRDFCAQSMQAGLRPKPEPTIATTSQGCHYTISKSSQSEAWTCKLQNNVLSGIQKRTAWCCNCNATMHRATWSLNMQKHLVL